MKIRKNEEETLLLKSVRIPQPMTESCRSDFFMPGKLLRSLPDVVCDQLDSLRFVGILQRRHEFPVLRGGGPDQPGSRYCRRNSSRNSA